ncbi:stromelysin-2-like [Camponotus floridanus]|uniref:stromelysin-2-like n=1 Tax=Camponotus floridanus TaxID=104421 RepID=UPI000DC6C0BE|nr:stromelysin-2-like [Camponotus floridanus]
MDDDDLTDPVEEENAIERKPETPFLISDVEELLQIEREQFSKKNLKTSVVQFIRHQELGLKKPRTNSLRTFLQHRDVVCIELKNVMQDFIEKIEEDNRENKLREGLETLKSSREYMNSQREDKQICESKPVRKLKLREYYALPGNGVLTVETIRVMRRPRCGVAYIHAYSPLTRKWPKTHLTWNFKLANRGTLRMTQSAFALWSEQSSLTFSRDPLRPDILISYQSGAHAYENSDNGGSCPSPFAGPGSVVAHAFFPTGGPNQVTEVHVDETEPWHITLTRPSSDRLYLLQTLTHEIGHTLGLTHSMREDSVMYAYTPSEERRYPLRLSIEDVINVRNLYGSRETTNPTIVDATPTTAATTTASTTTTTTAAAPPTTARTVKPPLAPSDTADLCALKRVDGTLIMNRRLYVARKRNVWPVDMRERRYGAPFSFADYF